MRLALVLLALGLASSTAAADTKARRVTVLDLDSTTGPAATIAQAITTALREPWPSWKVLVLRAKDDARIRKECATRTVRCLAKAGKNFGLDQLVNGTVERFGPNGYLVTLRLVSTWTDRVAAFATVRLSGTAWQRELAGAVESLQDQLGDRRRRGAPIDI
jgi:hypothetical protein